MDNEMANDAWFRFWTADWDSGTNRMTNEEVGVYIRLVCDYYKNGALPTDPQTLMSVSHTQASEWVRIWGKISYKFKIGSDKLWHHERCDEEIEWRDQQHAQKMIASKLGVSKRRELGQLPKEPLDTTGSTVGSTTGCPSGSTGRSTESESESESDTKTESKNKRDASLPLISEIFEKWNALTALPKCLLISDKRRQSLRVRFNEPFFAANWRAALEKIAVSNFCLGGNDRGWKATFDWFISPDVVAKIMEGKYDTADKPKQKTAFARAVERDIARTMKEFGS